MSGAPKQKVVKVKNATELVRAIASNTKIVVNSNEPLNITKALDALIATGEVSAIDWDAPEIDFGVYFERQYDGPELVICGMVNLSIEGSNPNDIIDLQAAPRYVNILKFYNCENLKLANLKLGHTDGGTCSSGVLTLEECRGVTMNNTDLYGCGAVGLYIKQCNNVVMNQGTIYQCNENIMIIDEGNNRSNSITFNGCAFTNCYSGIIIGKGTKEITFNDCTFCDNKGELFMIYSPITMNNCDVEHHYSDESENLMIIRNGGNWITDYRDCKEMPDIEPDDEYDSEAVRRYAWDGYLEGDIHFRLEAEQSSNDLVIGEMTYFRKNGKAGFGAKLGYKMAQMKIMGLVKKGEGAEAMAEAETA